MAVIKYADSQTKALPVLHAADIEKKTEEQGWLIKSLWGRAAVGVIGGQPKCCKSWLGLDMAVSIASGTACLSRFQVEQKGTVLVYLAEDSTCMVRGRIEDLCLDRNLDIKQLDLQVITVDCLRLDLLNDQNRLKATVDRFRPLMLLLDPLVRIHRLDENSSHDISGLLGFFRQLQRTFDMAVVLVHHASKKHRANIGQSLRGSSDLHAFGDSNAYLSRNSDKLLLTLEHRAHPAPDPFVLKLVSRADHAGTHLEILSEGFSSQVQPNIKDAVCDLLKNAAAPLFRKDIRARLKVNNHKLGLALDELEKQGHIKKTKNGCQLIKNTTFIGAGLL